MVSNGVGCEFSVYGWGIRIYRIYVSHEFCRNGCLEKQSATNIYQNPFVGAVKCSILLTEILFFPFFFTVVYSKRCHLYIIRVLL